MIRYLMPSADSCSRAIPINAAIDDLKPASRHLCGVEDLEVPDTAQISMSGNPCQLNRSMQHLLISWSDNASLEEPICLADAAKNLARGRFRLVKLHHRF